MAVHTLYIWSDLGGSPILAGALGIDPQSSPLIGEFQYSPTYRASGLPPLDPINLPLTPLEPDGRYIKAGGGGIYGVISDAGPDAWGRRVLMNLYPKIMGRKEVFTELLLSGGAGVGALTFSKSRTTVKARVTPPTLSDLGAAAEALHTVEIGKPLREHLRQMLTAGTSIGGVNPKIVVTDGQGQFIVKFKARDQAFESPLLEHACMRLANECGIDVADTAPGAVGQRSCIHIRRFDITAGGSRLQYASAHALWNRATFREGDLNDWSSYPGMAKLLSALQPDDPSHDQQQLFRRLCFNVVIGNTDDHGRNHGFLGYSDGTWRLSKAFDICPPLGSNATHQALGVGVSGNQRTFANVLSQATSFSLGHAEARRILEGIAATANSRYIALMKDASVPEAERLVAVQRLLLK